jgi:metal-responsive CopG/Arc/MetJ family transcriptional regulator
VPEQLVTFLLDKKFLDKVDALVKQIGFPSRTSFLKFALEETMEKHIMTGRDVVLVNERFLRKLMRLAQEKATQEITEAYQKSVKEILTKMVLEGTMKVLAERGEVVK